MDYREKLQTTMELREWSLRKLAHLSGVSKSSISTVFNDSSRDMSFLNVVALAQVLDVSLDWLAGLPSRTSEELTPDEEALLMNYRAIKDDAIKGFILSAAKDAPKK